MTKKVNFTLNLLTSFSIWTWSSFSFCFFPPALSSSVPALVYISPPQLDELSLLVELFPPAASSSAAHSLVWKSHADQHSLMRKHQCLLSHTTKISLLYSSDIQTSLWKSIQIIFYKIPFRLIIVQHFGTLWFLSSLQIHFNWKTHTKSTFKTGRNPTD